MNKLQNLTKFIAIDGHGGSGKSTLANKLASRLNAEVIHIDDFTGEGASSDWYKNLITKIIDPVQHGAIRLNYSRAKWWPEHDPKPVVNQIVTPTMIIEGVGSTRAELRNLMALRIFVDTPRSICIERGIERDKGMGGKSELQIRAMWQQWIMWDDEYFAKDDPVAAADIVVDGTEPYEQSMQTIVNRLSNLPLLVELEDL